MHLGDRRKINQLSHDYVRETKHGTLSVCRKAGAPCGLERTRVNILQRRRNLYRQEKEDNDNIYSCR